MKASKYYFYTLRPMGEEYCYFAISPLKMYPILDDSEEMDKVVEKLINPIMPSGRVQESMYETDDCLEEEEIISILKSLGFIHKKDPFTEKYL